MEIFDIMGALYWCFQADWDKKGKADYWNNTGKTLIFFILYRLQENNFVPTDIETKYFIDQSGLSRSSINVALNELVDDGLFARRSSQEKNAYRWRIGRELKRFFNDRDKQGLSGLSLVNRIEKIEQRLDNLEASK